MNIGTEAEYPDPTTAAVVCPNARFAQPARQYPNTKFIELCFIEALSKATARQ
jgi:hypothetical protein